MKHVVLFIAFLAFFKAQSQQINPVPDYVFRNQMSVGRNAVTDTAAYFSIGPRFGATKGMMPPMVGDTANVSATKRNGLLIFSLQKNKYLYWDSVGAKWAEMAGTTGSAIAGTLTTNYIPKATGTSTLGNSIMYDSSGHLRAYKNSLGNISDTRQALTVAMDGQNGYAFVVQQNDSLDNNIQYALSIRKNLLTSGKPRPGFGAAYDMKVPDDAGTMRRIGAQLFRLSDTTAAGLSSYMQLQLIKSGNAITPLQISSDSSVRLAKLAGSGTRYVVADANGDLTATSATSSTVGGSGTTNYVPKFTASSTIGNSQIFDNGTNVGIGTTSPSYKLHISGNTYVNAGTNLDLLIRDNGSILHMEAVNDAATSNIPFRIYGAPINLLGGAVKVNTTGTFNDAVYKLVVNTGTNRNIGIGSQSGEVSIESFNDALSASAGLRIYGAPTQFLGGEVLVNTSTDAGAYALQVNGDALIKNYLVSSYNSEILAGVDASGYFFASGGAATTNIPVLIGNAASSIRFRTSPSASSGTERMRIDGNGNVGIGTTSPTNVLHVAKNQNATTGIVVTNTDATDATSRAGLTLTSATTTGSILSIGTTLPGLHMGTTSNSPIFLFTNGSTKAFLSANGDLGIGTTSPAYKLDITGTLQSTGNTFLGTSSSEVYVNTTTDAGAYALQVAGSIYNTTGAVLAASSGNVGIGTTSPSGILDVSRSTSGGDVRVYMRNTATTASSTITIDLSEDGLLRSGIQYSPNTGETKFGNITTGSYAVTFYAGAAERIRLHNNGGLKFVGQSAAPTAEAGTVYYDTDDNKLKVYNGTTWVDLH